MRALRRALGAMLLGGLAALVVRLRGSGDTPGESGGWRELTGADFR